jgi:hypothetical protein
MVATRRFMWWSPTAITRWWLPRAFAGADENCNPSIAVAIPPLGCFIVFHKRGPLRTSPCEECQEFNDPRPLKEER